MDEVLFVVVPISVVEVVDEVVVVELVVIVDVTVVEDVVVVAPTWSCVTVKVMPAMVIVPCRAGPVFAATVKLTLPLPAPRSTRESAAPVSR